MKSDAELGQEVRKLVEGQQAQGVVALIGAVRELLGWEPLKHSGAILISGENENYEEGDEEAPFFTESMMYVLIGKDAARSLLARVGRVEEAIERLEDSKP